MSKTPLKILALLLPIILLLSTFGPAIAKIQHYPQPRLDEAYMKVITDPDAATAAFQTCEVEFYGSMIRWSNINKLLGEGQIMLASPGYHYCYIAFNCRDYVPNDAGQPDAGRPLAPMNWTNFRQALMWAGLSHAEKEAAILQIYGGPVNTAIDSPIPPSLGVWHYEPPIYPGCNYTYAWELLEGSGFTIVGNQLIQPNGVTVRATIEVLSPVEAPTSVAFTQKWVDKWKDFFENYLGLTNCIFIHSVIPFAQEVDRAFLYRNFDLYFLCYGLSKYPDYLYDIFHSSMDFPWGDNSYGIHDATLDAQLEILKYSIDYEAKVDACHAAQYRLIFDLSVSVYLYSRTYYNAFKDYRAYGGDRYLMNMVNQKGQGADNGWTWNLMHWDNSPTGGSVNYVLGATLTNLHPGWATTAYEWDVLGRLFEGMIGADPEQGDVPSMACYWSTEPFVWEPLGVMNGMKVRFQIRDGVYWHDGVPVTIEDAKFAFDFVRMMPQYSNIYQRILWTQIVDPCTLDVYVNVESQWLLYDLAGIAFLWPVHMYGETFTAYHDAADEYVTYVYPDGWLVSHGYNPVDAPVWTIDYLVGEARKALVGCGPYVFDYYSPQTQIAHVVKYNNYWTDGPIKANIIQPQRWDPCEPFEYTIQIVNTGSKDDITWELTPFIIDYIEITADGIVIGEILGPIVLDPFAYYESDPLIWHFDKGFHYMDVHVYGYAELYESYACPMWVTVRYDVNLDFYVGIDDIFAAANAFGSQPPPYPGYDRWDSRTDMNNDYYVGIDDIFGIASNFGWDA